MLCDWSRALKLVVHAVVFGFHLDIASCNYRLYKMIQLSDRIADGKLRRVPAAIQTSCFFQGFVCKWHWLQGCLKILTVHRNVTGLIFQMVLDRMNIVFPPIAGWESFAQFGRVQFNIYMRALYWNRRADCMLRTVLQPWRCPRKLMVLHDNKAPDIGLPENSSS